MTISHHGRRADSPDTDTDNGIDNGARARNNPGTDIDGGTGARTASDGDTGTFRIARDAGPAPAAPPRPAPADTRPAAAGTTKTADMTKTAEPGRTRPTAGNPAAVDGSGPLLPPELASRLTDRLEHAVGTFVDDPGRAVQEADEALDETVRRLTDGLRERRTALRDAWHPGGGAHRDGADDPSRTEDLRLSLRAYRDLLQHLLAA